eukprot:403335793
MELSNQTFFSQKFNKISQISSEFINLPNSDSQEGSLRADMFLASLEIFDILMTILAPPSNKDNSLNEGSEDFVGQNKGGSLNSDGICQDSQQQLIIHINNKHKEFAHQLYKSSELQSQSQNMNQSYQNESKCSSDIGKQDLFKLEDLIMKGMENLIKKQTSEIEYHIHNHQLRTEGLGSQLKDMKTQINKFETQSISLLKSQQSNIIPPVQQNDLSIINDQLKDSQFIRQDSASLLLNQSSESINIMKQQESLQVLENAVKDSISINCSDLDTKFSTQTTKVLERLVEIENMIKSINLKQIDINPQSMQPDEDQELQKIMRISSEENNQSQLKLITEKISKLDSNLMLIISELSEIKQQPNIPQIQTQSNVLPQSHQHIQQQPIIQQQYRQQNIVQDNQWIKVQALSEEEQVRQIRNELRQQFSQELEETKQSNERNQSSFFNQLQSQQNIQIPDMDQVIGNRPQMNMPSQLQQNQSQQQQLGGMPWHGPVKNQNIISQQNNQPPQIFKAGQTLQPVLAHKDTGEQFWNVSVLQQYNLIVLTGQALQMTLLDLNTFQVLKSQALPSFCTAAIVIKDFLYLSVDKQIIIYCYDEETQIFMEIQSIKAQQHIRKFLLYQDQYLICGENNGFFDFISIESMTCFQKSQLSIKKRILDMTLIEGTNEIAFATQGGLLFGFILQSKDDPHPIIMENQDEKYFPDRLVLCVAELKPKFLLICIDQETNLHVFSKEMKQIIKSVPNPYKNGAYNKIGVLEVLNHKDVDQQASIRYLFVKDKIGVSIFDPKTLTINKLFESKYDEYSWKYCLTGLVKHARNEIHIFDLEYSEQTKQRALKKYCIVYE